MPSQGAGIHSRFVLGGCGYALFLEKGWYGAFVLAFFFPLGKVRMGHVVDGTHPWQLCKSCDFIAQG